MFSYTKFNLIEALSNSKGKSSLGLLFGFLYGVAALVLYGIAVYCVVKGLPFYGDFFTQGAILTGASSTLIGVRRFTKDKEINNILEDNNDKS